MGRTETLIGGEEEYARLKRRLQNVMREAVPPGTRAGMVSRGDPGLIDATEWDLSHFPQVDNGIYAGHHPADSEEAIRDLETLRQEGGGCLIFPATAGWWLEHYEDFRRHLDRWYRRIVDDPETCVIFSLREPPPLLSECNDRSSVRHRELVRQLREVLAAMLPRDAVVLVLDDADADLALNDCEARFLGSDAMDGKTVLAAEIHAACAEGEAFLLVPAIARWRLDGRPEQKRHVETSYPLVVNQRGLGDVYQLRPSESRLAAAARR